MSFVRSCLSTGRMNHRLYESLLKSLCGSDAKMFSKMEDYGNNPCKEILLKETAPCMLMEKVTDMKISRPIMVGNVNILTASRESLANLIREAQDRIKSNADLASLSSSFRKEKEELEQVIKLCVEQLDKEQD